MSRPPQDGNGAYGANDATGADGIPTGAEPHGAPNVYHPRAESAPAYEEYTDPAIAHGWQNAYDETAELPQVVAGGAGAAAGRSAHRRPGGRRKPSAWRSRRTVVVAGAAGAVSVAAVIAGFAFSGSSSGDAEGKRERTSPTAGDSTTSTEPSDGSGTARSSDAAEPSTTKSPGDSASPSAAADGSGQPTTGSPTADPASTTPTATASTTAPGNSDGKPGRGQGGTKGPK